MFGKCSRVIAISYIKQTSDATGRYFYAFTATPTELAPIASFYLLVIFAESNIGYMSAVGKIGGRVFVTNYRLRFEAKDNSVKASKVSSIRDLQCERWTIVECKCVFWLLHSIFNHYQRIFQVELKMSSILLVHLVNVIFFSRKIFHHIWVYVDPSQNFGGFIHFFKLNPLLQLVVFMQRGLHLGGTKHFTSLKKSSIHFATD